MSRHAATLTAVKAFDGGGRRRWGRRAAVLALVGCGLSACSGESPRQEPSATPRAGASASGVAATVATPTPGVRVPPADAVFDYQIGGVYPPAPGVAVVDRDRAAEPSRGRYTICYVNAFQTQPAENPWWQARHRDLLLTDSRGRYVEDVDWPGERLLDISTPARRTELAAVVDGWIAGCAAHGFQAVEPDNLDSFTRSGGRLSEADAVAFARLLVASAHSHGLAIGQKNTSELAGSGHRDIGFDFAVAEECAVYDECDGYLSGYGDQVYEIEYTDNGTGAYRRACADHGDRISIILRDRDVVPAGDADYHYAHC